MKKEVLKQACDKLCSQWASNVSLRMMAVLMLVLMVLTPKMAKADIGRFDNEKASFSWYSNSPGCMHFSLLIGTQTSSFVLSPQHQLKSAVFKLVDEQGVMTNLFYFNYIVSGSTEYYACDGANYLRDESALFLTNDYSISPRRHIGSTVGVLPKKDAAGYGYVELDWFYPPRLAGKKMKLRVDGTIEEAATGGKYAYSREIGTIEFDDINFDTYNMIPGTESDEKGMLKIPFSCVRPVNWVEVSYTNELGVKKNLPRVEMKKNTYAGFILVPAIEEHHDMMITANVQASSWTDNPVGYDYPSEVNGNITVTYDSKNDVVMHNPRNLNTELLRYSDTNVKDAGVMQLQWEVKNPKYTDAIEGDQFNVLRTLTGKMEDLEQIGTVMVDEDLSTYTFRDETLTSALTEDMLKNTQLPVTYVVVRTSAQQLWGVENNAALAYNTYMLDYLHLLRIFNYKAQWEDKMARTVKVSWDYANEYGAVWDNRAKITLLVTSTNRAGAQVDSIAYTLTADEMTARSKVVQLNRSCVDYKIQVYVERGSSPLPFETRNVVFEIASTTDWNTFAEMVQNDNAQNDINVLLTADITVTTPVGKNYARRYRGTFDGNGHTITYNVVDNSIYGTALFNNVGNAVIRNLHVAGSIKSKSNVAGLIANIDGDSNVLIESCRVSATLTATDDSDNHTGGFVSSINANKLTLRHCLFDGSIEGDNASGNGGFVGYSNSTIIIENSLFAPTHIGTKSDDCRTWARMNNDDLLTVTNSYSTTTYGQDNLNVSSYVGGKTADELLELLGFSFWVKNSEGKTVPLTVKGYSPQANLPLLIRSYDDWMTFESQVRKAGGAYDVNAVLMTDITTDEAIGWEDYYPFRGTFDGNGHTLSVNIDNASAQGAAPFRYVTGNVTFKDLQVKGVVKGGLYASGLVGCVVSKPTVNFERVRVSVQVETNTKSAAGFLGNSDNAVVTVSDCLFDGKITASVSGSKVGSICGWGGEGRWTMHRVFEDGTYSAGSKGFSYDSYDSKWWGTNSRSTNLWSTHNWNEMPDEAHKNVEDQQMVVNMMNAEKAGSWYLAEGKAVPKTSDNDFYYENLGHIDQNSLAIRTMDSSVILTWTNVGDEPVDYYEVWRSDVQDADNFQRIATQLAEMEYEDKTTSPVHQYWYYVRGVSNCEGTKYDDTKKVKGNCSQTGTVSGYFTFADGTGIPDVKVLTTLANNIIVANTTDENGYFIIKDLPYVNGTATSYDISVNLNGYDGTKTITFGTKPGENIVNNVELVMEKSVKLSGYVQYNGTSIPVQGVSFIVDKREVHSAAGKIVTDHEGKFTFRMLPGDHTIRAVKDGHTFFRGGYYHEKDSDADKDTIYNFNIDKAGLMFYDDTRVKLIGRVAGGKEQGEMPLGNSLSKNNLGDDLQLVLSLEGDNASRLVWDPLDRNKKERDEVFTHAAHDKKYNYQTKVHTTLNRMVVTPDVHTGEYEVLLPPVKWKIQQITAKGYATLFQDGQVGDVIDLTDSLTLHRDTIQGLWKNAEMEEVNTAVVEYNAQYSRIYHSPVLIEYKQQSFDPFPYFGDRYYNFKNVTGDKQKLALAYGVRKEGWPEGKKDSLDTKYTFGYPVFSVDRKYAIKIAVVEKYYYNNNTKSDTIDVIRLSGGEVAIHNGMISSTHKDVVQLDSVGEALYTMEAAQTPYLLTGEDALRTVTMTLEMDGTHYEAAPLRAYVFNVQTRQGAKDIMSYSVPQLLDILRDPPGGTSKATISKGSSLKYNYTMDMKWEAGASIGLSVGWGLNTFTGLVAAPMGAGGVGGFNNGTSSQVGTSLDFVWSGSGQRAFSYTMTFNEDISTSSEKSMVGADADLYMGVEQNIVVKPGTAIRAIPDSVFRQMEGQLKSGRTVEIAQGFDDMGKKLHLVRDEVVTYGPVITSNFIHSQSYILKQLLPQLENQCLSLLFTGSKEEAQQRADATGEVVYWSSVGKDDENFGVAHEVIVPKGTEPTKVDEVNHYHNIMLKWMEMIGRNEQEKLRANDLVKNISLDGGGSLSYSESFTSDYSQMSSTVSPFEGASGKYFDDGENAGTSVLSLLGPVVSKLLKGVLKGKVGGTEGSTSDKGDNKVEVKAVGIAINITIDPALGFSVTPKHTESKTYSRKESFSIGMDKKSHLDFDVYRVNTASEGLDSMGVNDIFVNNDFYKQEQYNYEYLKRELELKNYLKPHSFVYRTRGGATCRPWEDERKTIVYNPGTVIDERTKKIENPVIKMDKQSVSGVPFGEPARFTLYLSNESELPEAAYAYFDLYMADKSNPYGAKMVIDGVPLSGNSRSIEVRPGQITEKTLNVYADEKFDYEGLKIGLISQGDLNVYQEVSFDVHFLQTAGSIAISTPGDKWIMNCDAPQEAGKGWYLPVVISSFDKNQKNFDHIEFQYKESTRGDDYWTNLCGFYADSTIYRAASGTKAMIPENGNIMTRFFGEGQVMEKAYDLRAVLFCRNGNSFLTNSSKVLSGVKDTRRPQLFGTPEPKSGVLGAGENIIFNFSEDIEYNYLQATTNFEVVGETNETTIEDAPSLQFDGFGWVMTDTHRNFTDKNVTVEVMIKPDDVNEDMPIFTHGAEGKTLQLWLTKEKTLRAVVDDKVLESEKPITGKGFQRVAMVLDNDHQQLLLYSDELDAKMNNVVYSGRGYLAFGAVNNVDAMPTTYKGRMLQARIWNRVMDLEKLNYYGNRLLTGYELGLVDYYPMNDGKGDYAADLAQGAHLQLVGASWALPNSMSLKFDKNETPADVTKMKGHQLKSDFFNMNDERDYTLMFWFKTSEENGTLFCNGSGQKTDVNAKDRFFIGFENHILKYRTNGNEYTLGDDLCDDRWHHFAMTVNRMRQVASIYINDELKAQFDTDSLGGMKSTGYYLGNMVWQEEGLENDKDHQANALTGYIDGLALFSQALPVSLIKRYARKALGGKEKGLKVYVDFNKQKAQMTGEIVLEPYPLNQVVKLDNDGNDTGKRDTVFVDSATEILAHIDQNIGAPMQPHEELHKLNFSFVGRDNQLLVNIDEKDSRINKRNIYVTVADIPDKNGNFMASPMTDNFFVDRNPLRWSIKRYSETLAAGKVHKISLEVSNEGATAHTYTIENLPRWMTVSKTSDVVEPLSTDELVFTISKDVNVGSYDHIIYLTDEDGLSEPLPLDITIEGEEPDWSVDAEKMHYSMNVVGQVLIANTFVTDARDKVGVFDADNNCMGSNYVKYDSETGRSMVYLTIYGSTTEATPLFFRLWHYATGKMMQLNVSQMINFSDQSIVGTMSKPVVMNAEDMYFQQIDLKKGWNWISFNVYNAYMRRVNDALGIFHWQDGDIVTEDSKDLTLVYRNKKWMSNTKDDLKKVSLSQEFCYRVKVNEPRKIDLWGTCLKEPEQRTIHVKEGWNSIGYTPLVNLPVSTALSEYFDNATDGDVIKNQHDFAMFSSDGKGGGEWFGTLEYMKPGEGYMLHSQKQGSSSFRYPFYEPGETFIDTSSRKAPQHSTSAYSTTMSVVAEACGVEVGEGDLLIAYANGEVVGATSLRGLFYLSIEGEQEVPLSFAIERGGEIIATTGEVITYEANAVKGTTSVPMKINFMRTDQLPQQGWYTVQGIKLDKAPKHSGVYIFNGKKQVIK